MGGTCSVTRCGVFMRFAQIDAHMREMFTFFSVPDYFSVNTLELPPPRGENSLRLRESHRVGRQTMQTTCSVRAMTKMNGTRHAKTLWYCISKGTRC